MDGLISTESVNSQYGDIASGTEREVNKMERDLVPKEAKICGEPWTVEEPSLVGKLKNAMQGACSIV